MANQGLTAQLIRVMGRALSRIHRSKAGSPHRTPSHVEPRGAAYPGDFRGIPPISYEPNPGNGKVADPGEIIWTWVPFEEDHTQGKDRPVLVIGRDGPWLLGLQLTSKDHDEVAVHQARAGRRWTDIGAGTWDNRGRASEVRVDRILRIDQAGVRRVGAVLDEHRFNQVALDVRRPAR